MTNTIPNVPRELLAELQEHIHRHHDAVLWGKVCDLLSTPSPAGVDGCQHSHSAAPRQPEGETFIGEPLIAKFVVVSRESLQALFRAAGCSGAVENSEVVNAGVRAIDGLRGEVAKINRDRLACWAEFKVMTRACLDAEKERDQQAQWIGELEGLLRETLEDMTNELWQRIDAALSAGKEVE